MDNRSIKDSTMKIIIFCAVVCAITPTSLADIPDWDGFTAQFSPNPLGINKSGFFKIPRTLAEADSTNWTPVQTTHRTKVTMRCKDGNQAVCPIYSKNGQAVGLVLSFPVSIMKGQKVPYNINRWNFFEKKMINGVEYWSCTLYVVHPDTINAGGRTGNNVGLGDGIWYQTGDKVYNIPANAKDLAVVENGIWKKQACFPGMGTHWGKNTTRNLDCKDHFIPAPLTTRSGLVHGIAFQLPGNSVGYAEPWFEDVPVAAAKMIFPEAPSCLYDWVNDYGLISLHIWFTKSPYFTTCF